MKIANATLLITGANRGIGLAFAREALARGARKVYAGVRDPSKLALAGVEAVRLDVTRPDDAVAAASRCSDVTLLINNAGIAAFGGLLSADAIESARAHLETNFFGPLYLSRAFAPVLAANGGGAILNVLSVASWINAPLLAMYGISKSAAWALTNGLRNELRGQRTQVLGMHVGFVDTDLTRDIDLPKSTPEAVVQRTFDALEAGAEEALVDERSRQIKRALTAEPPVYLLDPSAAASVAPAATR
jgi:NAD(P)-dependent dehydrogenase (short-subunit alcohol dehydrogenase family)